MKESAVRNLKLAYKERLRRQQEVAEIPHKPRGCPPILLELEQEKLSLPPDQKPLLIWDVFRGQMTAKVKQALKYLLSFHMCQLT